MERANIDRINELKKLSLERELTEQELAEREQLRNAYRKAFREQFRQQLDNTVVEYPDGTRKTLRESQQK